MRWSPAAPSSTPRRSSPADPLPHAGLTPAATPTPPRTDPTVPGGVAVSAPSGRGHAVSVPVPATCVPHPEPDMRKPRGAHRGRWWDAGWDGDCYSFSGGRPYWRFSMIVDQTSMTAPSRISQMWKNEMP
jgi:hypothetical protein